MSTSITVDVAFVVVIGAAATFVVDALYDVDDFVIRNAIGWC